MQQACQTLADTGANIAPYIAIAFGLMALSALTFYFLHSGRRLNKGFFSLLIVFMMAGSFILIPTKSLAATPNCTPAGQTAGAGATAPTPTPTPSHSGLPSRARARSAIVPIPGLSVRPSLKFTTV